jgi:palmitoyltransferase
VPGSAGAADAPAAGAADDEAAEDEEEQEEEAASDRAGISAGDSSRNGSSDSSGGGGNSTAAGGASVAPKAKRLPNAEVLLSHLRSYEGMGVAQVRCVSGCTCTTTYLDGTWEQQATLQYIHRFKVSQHAKCRVRVRVTSQAGAVPQQGRKVTLMGLMVSHIPIRMHTRDDHAEQLSNVTRRLL